MSKKVNIAIQIIPKTQPEKMYSIIDEAIHVIQSSGLKYRVCPFETVVEGEYEQILEVTNAAQQACFAAGAEEVLVNLKIQRSLTRDITMEEKTHKYD